MYKYTELNKGECGMIEKNMEMFRGIHINLSHRTMPTYNYIATKTTHQLLSRMMLVEAK